MTDTLLLTGPIGDRTKWTSAAEAAGWKVLERPLIEVVENDFDLVQLIDGLPDWICVTSSSALNALQRAAERMPELLTARFACVGVRTEERARSIGFKAAFPASPDASTLATRLQEALPPSATVLWPRGSLSSWLGDELTSTGLTVLAPVVYDIKVLDSGPLLVGSETARAILLASPSAVRAYTDRIRAGEAPISVCIAIGQTTALALDEQAAILEDVRVLEQPTPDALQALLRTLQSPDHDS